MSLISTIFLPHFCIGCFRPGVALCVQCSHKIKTYDVQKCIYCGKKAYFGITHAWCKDKTPLDGVYSLFYYRHPLKEMLLQIKYRHNRRLLDEMLQILPVRRMFLLWELKKIYENLMVVSVPQTLKVTRERGFNQAAIIGNFFSSALHLPLLHTLSKIKETKHQSLLSERERSYNLHGVYTSKYIPTKRVPNFLLMDDVITTGSTITEAAGTLKKTWTKSKVFALSLLRSH